jgi:hypothetical protein
LKFVHTSVRAVADSIRDDIIGETGADPGNRGKGRLVREIDVDPLPRAEQVIAAHHFQAIPRLLLEKPYGTVARDDRVPLG